MSLAPIGGTGCKGNKFRANSKFEDAVYLYEYYSGSI